MTAAKEGSSDSFLTPHTPAALRWSPAKRPVTEERATLMPSRGLGSPIPMRKHNMRALAPAPPLMPLAPSALNLQSQASGKVSKATTRPSRTAPARKSNGAGKLDAVSGSTSGSASVSGFGSGSTSSPASGSLTESVTRTKVQSHADLLRARLRLAYFRVRTNQIDVPLSKINL